MKLKIKIQKITDPEPPVWISAGFIVSEGEKVLFEEFFEISEEDVLNLKNFFDSRIGKKSKEFYRSKGTVLFGEKDDFEPQTPEKIYDLDHNYYISGDPNEKNIEVGFFNNDPKSKKSLKGVYKIKLEETDLKILANNLALDLRKIKIN